MESGPGRPLSSMRTQRPPAPRSLYTHRLSPTCTALHAAPADSEPGQLKRNARMSLTSISSEPMRPERAFQIRQGRHRRPALMAADVSC
jgi:hypothetical protein